MTNMCTDGHERYLRYIYLLGEGVLLVLREIVKREVSKLGKTLKAILSIPSNRSKLEKSCRFTQQREHLFPSPSLVNADIETWDISLLTIVLQNIFWSTLSQDELLRICYLRDCRNEFQGHPPTVTFAESEYKKRSSILSNQLEYLASKLDQQTIAKVKTIIFRTQQIKFDLQAAENHLEKMYGYKEEILQALDEKSENVNSRLDTVQGDISCGLESLRNISTLQEHMHENIQDVKTIAEESKRSSSASLAAIEEVKSENQDRFSEMLGKLIALEERIGKQDFKQDVDTQLNVAADTPQTTNRIQNTLVEILNDILSNIRTTAEEMTSSATINNIETRTEEILSSHEGSNHELAKGLLELIKDLLLTGEVLGARKGSILLTMRFSSYKGLHGFYQYLDSENLQRRLDDISRALIRETACIVSLRLNVHEESLCRLQKHVSEEYEKLKVRKSVLLPIQCRNVTDLSNIWKLLNRGGAKKHLQRISKILSKMTGENVIVSTSVNLQQFKDVLLDLDRRYDEIAKITRISVSKKVTGHESQGSMFDYDTQTITESFLREMLQKHKEEIKSIRMSLKEQGARLKKTNDDILERDEYIQRIHSQSLIGYQVLTL